MLSSPIQLYKKAYSGLSRNSWYLCLVMFINRSGTMVIPFMTIYCRHELHFSVSQATLVMAAFGAGSILGAFIGGRITDKIGFYYVQVMALLIGGVLFMVLGYQQTFISASLGAFVLSICNEAFRPANSTAVAYYSSGENLTRSNSLNRLAVNLGWAFGGLLGGTLAGINYHLLFWVDGSTNILAALLLLKLIPASKVMKQIRKSISTGNATSPYRDRVYLAFVVCAIIFATCFFHLFTMQPLYYKGQWHFSEFYIGLLMGINGVLIVIFEMVLIHNLENKRHPLNYICAGSLVIGAGFVLLNYLPASPYSALVILLFITVGEMLAMPFMNSFWIMRTNPANRGQYAAMYTIAWSTAQIISPIIGGQVVTYSGYFTLWWLTGAMCLGASLGFVMLFRKNFKEKSVPLEETVF
ncbi:MAG TPA: MFS transporter [Mucilaginibacter sp.]|nr:MFS transporter [Mucilaginibacter sp.]